MAITRYLVAGAIALSALAADAAQLPYRFDKIAETGAGFTGLDFPAMNDLGVVSFGATDAAGHRVFYGTPFITVPVATPAGLVVTGSRTGINNAGQVIYTARPPPVPPEPNSGADGVYRTEPTGTITTIASPGRLMFINGGPVINNSGQVAWTVFNTVVSTLNVGDGTGQPRDVVLTPGNIFDPHISNAGRITAIETTLIGFALYLDNQTIVSSYDGNRTPFTDPDFGTAGTLVVKASDVAVGDRVVFAADWFGQNAQTKGVYLWDSGTISKLLAGSDLSARPAINDNDTVAALLTSGGDTRLSIVRPGGEDRLIGIGDPLFGSTVTSLDWVAEGFNNLDQFTFRATLADGRDVIVLAQIPEPGSALLLVASAGVLVRRRSRA